MPIITFQFVKRACFVVFPLCVAGIVHAQNPATSNSSDKKTFNFNAYLEQTRARYNLPALSVLVMKDGKVFAKGTVGVRKAGDVTNRITTEDKLLLGSCSKSFGATICGVLVERGQLRWDTLLEQTFPELGSTMRPEFRKVTLASLLSHTAGFHNVLQKGPTNTFADPVQKLGEDHSRRYDFTVKALLHAPEFPPGSRYNYSNVGPIVAALMAERASGVDWETLLRRSVYEPLGMSSAGIERPEPIGGRTQPWGHDFIGGRWIPTQMNISSGFYAASGGVFSSITDWAKYIQFHMTGGTVMKDATRVALHTPPYPSVSSGYALGWAIGKFPWSEGEKVFFHGGGNGSQTAMVWVFPKRNFAVLFQANAQGDVVEKAKEDVLAMMVKNYLEDVSGQIHQNASQANLTGSLKLNAATSTVGGGDWKDTKSTAVWTVPIPEPGLYQVNLLYSLPKGIAGAYVVKAGEQVVRKPTTNTDGWADYRSDEVMTVQLTNGPVTVTVSQDSPHTTFINVSGIYLRKM